MYDIFKIVNYVCETAYLKHDIVIRKSGCVDHVTLTSSCLPLAPCARLLRLQHTIYCRTLLPAENNEGCSQFFVQGRLLRKHMFEGFFSADAGISLALILDIEKRDKARESSGFPESVTQEWSD